MKRRATGSRSRSKTAQDLNGLSGFPARFERFGRFFLKKPLKPLKSCFKLSYKFRLGLRNFDCNLYWPDTPTV